jgi:hypothetical protein
MVNMYMKTNVVDIAVNTLLDVLLRTVLILVSASWMAIV